MHPSPVSTSMSWLPFRLYRIAPTGRSTMRRAKLWGRTFPIGSRRLVIGFRADPVGKSRVDVVEGWAVSE